MPPVARALCLDHFRPGTYRLLATRDSSIRLDRDYRVCRFGLLKKYFAWTLELLFGVCSRSRDSATVDKYTTKTQHNNQHILIYVVLFCFSVVLLFICFVCFVICVRVGLRAVVLFLL